MTGTTRKYKPVTRCSSDSPLCVVIERTGEDEFTITSNVVVTMPIFLTNERLQLFIQAVANGMDVGGNVWLRPTEDGFEILDQETGRRIPYNEDEINAFRAGCSEGEFAFDKLSVPANAA